MLKELQDIGLSEKEARVYLAALELGPSTAEKLAGQAKVNRSTTYVQLESLMKKGLVSSYEEGKKTVFTPESPSNLQRIFDIRRTQMAVQEKELGNLLPDLVRMFESAGDRPLVRFYSGKEGIRAMRDSILDAKDKNILVLHSYDALASVFSEKERDEYSERRSDKGISAKIIYNRDEGALPDDLKSTNRCHVSEDILKVTNDIVIVDNKVAIANLRGELFGVLIENTQIADSMRSIFAFMWKMVHRLQENKK